MARRENPQTIQVWPSGRSYTFRGDPDGPENQRSLKTNARCGGELSGAWVKGTDEEWREIRIALRAQLYADREIWCCDSSLVDDLIKQANAERMYVKDLADAFSYDEIRNLYKDPSEWDEKTCREYIREYSSWRERDRDTDIEELRDACREIAQDNPAEVYEWWRVSSWLCDQLDKIGEVTIDNGYGHWWGRTCSGQAYIMDGTLQQVAAMYENVGSV